MLKPWNRARTHEDLFVEHYGWLRSWARQLTGHDAAQADDLLHDAYVRFAVGRPPLETIGNPQAYLYALLRNLHLSTLRRATAPFVTDLSAVDAESVRDVLARVQPDELLRVRHELEVVCDWACARKDAFKGAGFLILRFFHGYVPGEIARIGRTSAKSVDDFLRLARQEVRAALRAPARRSGSRIGIDPSEPDAFIQELRGRIFESRHDGCLDERVLIEHYERTNSIATRRLAHIVSCAPCLDRVSGLLGLTSHDDWTPGDRRRGPRDPNGGGQPPPPAASDEPPLSGPRRRGPTESGGGNAFRTRSADLAIASESAEAIREHRPTELVLAANGWVVAWHPVNSAITEQQVSLPIDEPVGFVEVFNGAGLGLLYLPIDPPPGGDAEQSAVVTFGNDRMVEARVRFGGPRPTLWVRYGDPHFAAPEHEAIAVAKPPEAPPRRERRWGMPRRPRPARLVLAFAWIVIAFVALSMPDRVWAAAGRITRAILVSIRSIAEPVPAPLPSKSHAPAYAPPPPPTAPVGRIPPPAAAPAARSWTEADLADIEVRVLLALDRVNALMGEQITVVRQAQGVRVEGIVDSVARRQSIVAALKRVGGGAPVHVHLLSVGEALETQAREAPGSVTLRDYTIDRGTMPGAEAIRRRLTATDPSGAPADLERRVQQTAGALVDRSRRLLLHALALEAIGERYDAEALRQLNPSAFATWASLLRRHGWRVRDEARALRAEMQPLAEFATDRLLPEIAAGGDLPLGADIEELSRLAAQLDDGVLTAFAASPAGQPAPDLASLVALTIRLEHLGERVARFEP